MRRYGSKAVAGALVLWASMALGQRNPKEFQYDRLQVLENFLQAVYPDLQGQSGRMIVQQDYVFGQGYFSYWVQFVQCSPLLCSCLQHTALAKGLRWCAGPWEKVPSPYLEVSVMFWRPLKEPIGPIHIGGEFLRSGPLEKVKAEIAEHWAWDEQYILSAVEEADLPFGPQHRKEFLAKVPVAAIRRYTGCSLELNSAVFSAGRLNAPRDPPDIEVVWRVFGKDPKAENCSAEFEPAHGRVISIYSLYVR